MSEERLTCKRKKKTCEICNYVDAIYKCPKCEIGYCSAKCFKTHKESGCLQIERASSEISNDTKELKYEFETEDTVPLEKLKLLSEDPELKAMLANPYLRDMLKNLVATFNSSDITTAMKIPIFEEFVNKCLKIVE